MTDDISACVKKDLVDESGEGVSFVANSHDAPRDRGLVSAGNRCLSDRPIVCAIEVQVLGLEAIAVWSGGRQGGRQAAQPTRLRLNRFQVVLVVVWGWTLCFLLSLSLLFSPLHTRLQSPRVHRDTLLRPLRPPDRPLAPSSPTSLCKALQEHCPPPFLMMADDTTSQHSVSRSCPSKNTIKRG